MNRAVRNGRESVCQCPVTHGGADKEPDSIACLYSKEGVTLGIASDVFCRQEGRIDRFFNNFGQPPAVATHVTRGFTMEIQSFKSGCSGAQSHLGGPPRHTSSLAAPIPSRRRRFLPTPATEVFRRPRGPPVMAKCRVRAAGRGRRAPAGPLEPGQVLGRPRSPDSAALMRRSAYHRA